MFNCFFGQPEHQIASGNTSNYKPMCFFVNTAFNCNNNIIDSSEKGLYVCQRWHPVPSTKNQRFGGNILSLRPRMGERFKRSLQGVVVGAACLFCLIAPRFSEHRLEINVTDSLPRGLYFSQRIEGKTAEVGQIVLFDLDTSRTCPSRDPRMLLMKKVLAGPGQTVCLDPDTGNISLDGKVRVRSALYDERGRRISFAIQGCLTLTSEQIWVYTEHPRSCDSRVLGPIEPDRHIVARAFPLLTY